MSYLGCAGWNLPRDAQPHFAAEGSHLQRYASRLAAVEINSSGLLQALARRIAQALGEGREVWCIFDNTAASAAAHNAVDLQLALDKEVQ